MDPERKADLGIIKQFFEEMIGCVIGCGCWEPGWDEEDDLRSFAQRGFELWGGEDPASPREVLASLDRCFASLKDEDMPGAREKLELHFESADELRRFFERSRRVLDLELRGPGASPG